MRGLKSVLLGLVLVVAVPWVASAQATLAGVVRDASGGVLPGVTVEASSPVMIEKTRSVVTDANGRYEITDLRPGTYSASYSLTGFRTLVRDGLELSGTGVFTINAELPVGAVQETITVTGETPVVDLQSTIRQHVMDQEIVSAIPTSRTPFTVGVLIPGVRRGAFMSQDVGGSVVQEVASLEANGGRTFDQRMMVNGVALSSMIAGGWGGGAVPNATGTAEFAIDVSAVDAQAATGGVRINFIPRDGGNRFSGTIFASVATEGMASDNFTGSDVQARGLVGTGRIKKNGDFNPGIGGPILRDKLWFFISARSLYADNYVAGMFFNENVNNLNRFDYVRSSRQAILHQEQTIGQARFTWQANSRNKISSTTDWEAYCACTTGINATVSPEAGNDRRFPLQRFVTLDWDSPVTNKLLLEASAIHRVERWGGMHPQEGKAGNIAALTPGMTSVTDNLNPVTRGALTYRSAAQFNNSWNWNIHYRAAVSYITGSHNFKVGFNNAYGHHENQIYTNPTTPYSFNFFGGVPQAIVYRITPRTVQVNVNRDMGLFAQEKWTTGRWTLFGGIRFDHFKNSFPAQSIVGTFFGRSLNINYPEAPSLNWKDVTPKLGATYDVFGTGRTALKVTLNKYLAGLGTTGGFGGDNVSDQPNPINRLNLGGGSTNRTWTDNGDFRIGCNLNDFAANGECGPLLNASSFGAQIPAASYDPNLMTGWGKRDFNWEFTTSVQHEVVPRMSVEVQYARRWYGNFRVQDDLSVAPEDYTRFTFTVPTDSRLPNGGGYTLTAFDLQPAAALRAQNNFVTLASNYGSQTEVFNGVNVSVNARLQNGLMVQGGFGTGRVVTNDCEVAAKLPEVLHQFFGANTRAFFFTARPLERCEQNNGWRPQGMGLAAYTIPRIDVQVSATVQNLPGVGVNANANVFGTGTLGRGFALAPFRNFNLVRAGDLYVERLNQIDVRVAKIFRLGGTRTNVNFDFYNVTNSNAVIGENFVYAAPPDTGWRTPQTILLPRLFKLSAQFDF
jgi:hypothetical protein